MGETAPASGGTSGRDLDRSVSPRPTQDSASGSSSGPSSTGRERRLADRGAEGSGVTGEPGVTGGVVIRPEPVTSPVARRLLDAYVSELDRRWPGGFAPEATDPLRAESFRPPEGLFLVAWMEGVSVGCGGVRRLAADVGEVKRMWVSPEVRGRGIGRALLEALEAGAQRLGWRLLRLDTTPDLTAAVHLYRSAGYREIPPYNENVYAGLWFEKALVASRPQKGAAGAGGD